MAQFCDLPPELKIEIFLHLLEAQVGTAKLRTLF